MISNARDVPQGTNLTADVCIVGAGAAGLAMAMALRESGLKVLLLESGGDKDDEATQALYAGEVADERMHSPPDKYRKRVFGGSTTIWGGRSMPFNPIDFEKREHIAHSGWPIGFDDVAPYYPQANALIEAGDFDYSARSALPDAPPVIEGFQSNTILCDQLERFSCPTNFAARYRHRLAECQNVEVMLQANVCHIQLDANGQAVQHLVCGTLDGKRFQVSATRFVLATGGIEVARLLLASRDVMTTGIGNRFDQVGRYYMCHIAGNIGKVVFKGKTSAIHHGYDLSAEGVYCRRRFSMPAELQRELGVANVIARLHFPTITDPAHRNGVLSGLFLAKNFISYEYGKRLQSGERDSLGRYARHLLNVMTDPFDTTAFLLHWIRYRTLSERKFPSVVLKNRTNLFSLDVHGEQAPNPESRVTLTSDKDAMGMLRTRVDWRYSDIDIVSVDKMLALMASEFKRCGVGELTYDPSTLAEDLTMYGAYGGHHIGTARMGTDARTSVVNADGRLHDVGNLYVASAATFPTSSQANPTLTIVALALRLAAHLKTLAPQAS